MVANPYQKYARTRINTATPQELTLMLYDGAIKYCNISKKAIQDGDNTKANSELTRVQDIISEIMVGLDFENGGEIAQSLYNLYDYMKRRIIQANIKKDIDIIDEVNGLMKELRTTWAEAMRTEKKKNA